MSNFSLAQAPAIPSAPGLSYANLTAHIREFETPNSQRQLRRDRRYRRLCMTGPVAWVPIPLRRTPIMTAEASNPKLAKSGRPGADAYLTLSLSLAPADMAGIDLCPKRSPACTTGCLGHNSGHSVMGIGAANNRAVITPVRRARIARTTELFGSQWSTTESALEAIIREIRAFERRCTRLGKLPAVRMNAFSDIVWEKLWPELFARFPGVKFYDYTKIGARIYFDSGPDDGYVPGLRALPSNYSLTFSRSELNEPAATSVLRAGGNVAVVFGCKNPADLPKSWTTSAGDTYPVLDGTADDARFLDPAGWVIGLTWKGPTNTAAYTKSLNDAIISGFAVPVPAPAPAPAPTTSLTR